MVICLCLVVSGLSVLGTYALQAAYPSIACQIRNGLGQGPRCYYAQLTANVGECITSAATGQTECQSGHNVVYNSGITNYQDIAMGQSCTVATCGSYKFIALSNNGGTPAAGDSVTGIECGGAGNQLTTNGAAAASSTVTVGTGASSQTTTVVHTFTASSTGFTAQKSCLMNESTVDANDQPFAAALFTSATLAAGDTLAVTWTITVSF